jgi:hypothetical protein
MADGREAAGRAANSEGECELRPAFVLVPHMGCAATTEDEKELRMKLKID